MCSRATGSRPCSARFWCTARLGARPARRSPTWSAQVISAALFVRALLAERVRCGPQPTKMRAAARPRPRPRAAQPRVPGVLRLRAAVAAHTSTAAGRRRTRSCCSCGSSSRWCSTRSRSPRSRSSARRSAPHDEREARALAWQVTGYGLVFGVVLGVRVRRAGRCPARRLFTWTPRCSAEVPHAWWFFVALQPVAGVVFALDGVLLGAGDAAFLRNAPRWRRGRRVPAAGLGRPGFGWGLAGSGRRSRRSCWSGWSRCSRPVGTVGGSGTVRAVIESTLSLLTIRHPVRCSLGGSTRRETLVPRRQTGAG